MVATTAPLKEKEITGLQLWDAAEFNRRMNMDGLKESRLGAWSNVIFKDYFINGKRVRKDIPVFRMPSYSELIKYKERPTAELPLGSVCWRALMSRYVDEEKFIHEQNAKENPWKDSLLYRTEVGSFGLNIACYASTVDIYKIIFSNLEPVDWAKIELNKAERIMTNIGDFSMLYLYNAKWFHFVPSYNGIPAGQYEQELKLLLEHGHTFNIGGFNLTGNGNIIGAWSLDSHKAIEGGQEHFTKAVERHILALADVSETSGSDGGDVDMVNDGDRNGASDVLVGKSVFFGGVATAEKEYKVSRVLANVIHNALWLVGRKLIGDGITDQYQNGLPEALGSACNAPDLLESVQVSLLAAQTFSEVREMASDAKKIVSKLIFGSNKQAKLNEETLTLGLACTKAFGVLHNNLSPLDWNVSRLDKLDQLVWLAGTVDTVDQEVDGRVEGLKDSEVDPAYE